MYLLRSLYIAHGESFKLLINHHIFIANGEDLRYRPPAYGLGGDYVWTVGRVDGVEINGYYTKLRRQLNICLPHGTLGNKRQSNHAMW